MKVGVATPFYNEVEYIGRCISSVQASKGVTTFQHVVCDGAPPPCKAGPGYEILPLTTNYNDIGCTPRYVAAMECIRYGCDYIAFLDADNWYDPTHLQKGIEKIERNKVDFACTQRMLYSLKEEPIGPCHDVVGGRLIDTNCLIVSASCFENMIFWLSEGPKQPQISDQLFARALLQSGKRMIATTDITVGYRTRYALHYRMHGRMPPPDAV